MSEYRTTLERELERLHPPRIPFDELCLRRDRRHRDQRIRAGALAIALLIAVGWLVVNAIRSAPPVPADDPTPTPAPSEELGIFEPVAGRIVYHNAGVGYPSVWGFEAFDLGYQTGLWAVDPASPEDPQRGPVVAAEIASTLVQLSPGHGTPLGWSGDGTKLLILRGSPGEAGLLSILHADGSETQVTTDPMLIEGAAISPDGSHVVFAGWGEESALYTVDAEGGRPMILLEDGDLVQAPTFSPDGTQIAYVTGGGDHSNRVWVMDADGSDLHEIVSDEVTGGGHAFGLVWSPAGDRIALAMRTRATDSSIFTFAPDGSDLTRTIKNGSRPYWSPDGSQLAYTIACVEDFFGCGLAIADADGSNVHEFGFATSGPWHPANSVQRDEAPPLQPTIGEPVLHLQSWRLGFVEVAVYADGRVIWVADDRVGYLEQRLTREGVEQLLARAVSSGLFEHDLALGLDLRFGNMKVRSGDRSVIVAWGGTPDSVSGLGLQDRFVDATPAQASELTELEAFFRDPTAWGLPREMYRETEIKPFVPTHLWGSYDRGVPDLSNLPSPAREIVTRHLGPWISGECETISIDEARKVRDALIQARLFGAISDMRLGFSFDLGPSFVHFHPALPDEVDCP